ncbi:amidohydrolase family protein [Stappia sp. GBMRC 2046]|uniref:Amidohydrolase family protein n=1 Tax=Stappia sediminis TaxID=2692190 RepID=A0A7X3LRQ7_9HYPH|nr:amidohydrolase [Stappia sediminis]MXN63865.1 amidohydrolase family protein [Stappia sediminis]
MFRPVISIAALIVATGVASAQTAQPADFVFTNGKVYTVDKDNSWAEAVAVRGNEIVYVGDDTGAEALVGDGTETINLEGRMMLPGFVEGHFHTTTQGIILHGPDLQTDTMDELLAKLKEYADANPDLEFINGWGVRPNLYGPGEPTAEMIDAVVPDRPVYLWQVDGHSAWINTKAMEMAGLDKDTPDTVPGASYFVRDDDGNPTGYIVEVPAQIEILNKFVTIDADYIREGMARWFPEYSKAGITAVHDFGWAGVDQDMAIGILKGFEEDGTLGMRIYGSYYWNDASIDPVPIAKKMRDENQDGLVQVNALKINMDGDDDKYSALLVEPYSDNPDADPEPIIPFDVMQDAAVRADKEKLHLLCHCFGDLAVRTFLDYVELAKEANPEWDRRAVASHATLVHPDDYPRFKELNATYDTTGQWMALDPYTGAISPERYGPERMKRLFPIKAILEAGGNVSLGSDFPAAAYVADYKPLNAITQAVTRQMLGKPDMPILGGEGMRLSVAEAIRANTYGAAYGTAVEDRIGSLEVGKLADLIVLDQNLFEIDPHDIYKTKVELTMMDGTVRHREGL